MITAPDFMAPWGMSHITHMVNCGGKQRFKTQIDISENAYHDKLQYLFLKSLIFIYV